MRHFESINVEKQYKAPTTAESLGRLELPSCNVCDEDSTFSANIVKINRLFQDESLRSAQKIVSFDGISCFNHPYHSHCQ